MDGNQIEVSTEDVVKAVRETSMLADLSISTWGGTQSDRALLNELKQNHGARGDVGRVIKNLMAGCDEPLKRVKGAFMAVRTRHYALTLPLVGDPHASRQEGARLLPTMLAERYLSEMAQGKKHAENELELFLVEYDNLIQTARSNLGTMAPALNEYPSADQLRSQFKLRFEIMPVPDSKSFGSLPGLSDKLMERLSMALNGRLKRQMDAANAEIWERVAVPLRNLIKRLETPLEPGSSARFKDATIENIRELCDFLPGWNVGGDARIDEITYDIKTMLYGVTGSELRKNEATRESVAIEARRVNEKLQAWGL